MSYKNAFEKTIMEKFASLFVFVFLDKHFFLSFWDIIDFGDLF
jgi:hypothetical protein